MARSIVTGMRLLEAGRFAEAADALAPVVGPSGDGVIARFRRAECFSRLGLHDAAVEEATRAAKDDPDHPPAPLWLAQVLAEAGRYEDAAAVAFPGSAADELADLHAGYVALARVAADADGDRAADAAAILDSRHSALYSLALRITETMRLSTEPRWPDLPSTWFAYVAFAEFDDAGKQVHPDLPRPAGRKEVATPERWVRLHGLCGGWAAMDERVRPEMELPSDADEAELERQLATGGLDEAASLLEKMVKHAGAGGGAELCIDRARLGLLRGETVPYATFPGYREAVRRLRPSITWLELAGAVLSGETAAQRPLADKLSDPSHREYVEAALLRWAISSGGGL